MLTKQEVTTVQSALREAGFLYKEPDGVWDLHTMQGYRNYLAVKLCAPNSQYISQPTSMNLVPDVLKGVVVEGNNSVVSGNNEPNGNNEPPAPETTEQPQVGQQPEVAQPDVQPTVPEQPTETPDPETPEQPEVEQPEVEQPESEEPEEPSEKPNKGKRSKTQNN